MPAIFTMPPPGQPMFPDPPPGIYEYTQILDFTFSDPSVPTSLSDDTTEIGKIWANTLQTYLELEQTGIVWWALVHKDTSKAKLIIDWKTAAGRQEFEASSQFQELSSSWQTVTSTPIRNNAYIFTHNESGREAGFYSEAGKTVSALFTFRFKTPPSASDKEKLDDSFLRFYKKVLHSPGGIVATFGILGWEQNRTSYCLAFYYMSPEIMQTFLESDEEARKLAEELQSYATGGTDLEFLETRAYKQGWQGSVDRTEPYDPIAERNAARWLADVEERRRLGISLYPTHMR